MDEPVQVEHDAFMRVIDKGQLRVMQIVNLALLGGVLTFVGVVALLGFQRAGAGQGDAVGSAPLLGVMTTVHCIMAAVFFPAGFLIHRWMAGPGGIKVLAQNPRVQGLPIEQQCAKAIFTGMIIRLAQFEGMALFGVIVCMVGIQSGELAEKPMYWVNLFSPVAVVLLVVATFPTRERIESLFLNRFTDQTVFNTL